KITVDTLARNNRFHKISSGFIAVRDLCGLLSPKEVFKAGIPFVRRKKMGGGAPRFASANADSVSDHQFFSCTGPQICASETRDAGADNAHISVCVLAQGREVRRCFGGQP